MRQLIFFIFLFFYFSCANKMYVDDFANKPLKNNNQNARGVNYKGAYYNIDERDKVLNVLFFYKNYLHRSLVFDTNHYDQKRIGHSINSTLERFKTLEQNNYQYFEDGGYRLNETEISIQRIRYITQFAWGVVTYKGKIINDSTILITEFKFPKRNIFKMDSMYYHFIKIERPDSLKGNRWKDKSWYWKE